jgi:hypothetical protein
MSETISQSIVTKGAMLFVVGYCRLVVLVIRKAGFWTGIFAGAIPILLLGLVLGLEWKPLKRPLAAVASGLVLLVLGAVAGRPSMSAEQRAKLRTVADEVKPLFGKCKGLPNYTGPLRSGALIWWGDEDRISAAYWQLPEPMRASPDDPAMAVFLIQERDYHPGQSNLGSPGMSSEVTVDVCVAEWPTRIALGTASLMRRNSITPARSRGQESFIVPTVAKWVEGLGGGRRLDRH